MASNSNLRHQNGPQFRTQESWLDRKFHSNGSIKKPDEMEMKSIKERFDTKILERVQGSLVGMALGDAVGAHVEFRPQAFLVANPVKDLHGGGTWGLKTGQFTDDTSMALCLASSLIVCRDFNPYDQLVRYKWWYKQGYMSSTGQCFDIGAATRNSLIEFENRQKTFGKENNISSEDIDFLANVQLLKEFDVNCSKKGVAGNGALMRLAPVPLFFYRQPDVAVEFSGISGRITHGDDISCDACRYYGALIVAALYGETKEQLLSNNFYQSHEKWFKNKPLHPEIMNIAEGSYQLAGKYGTGIRGKGYVVHTLEAALWAFHNDNESFEKGVLNAVNLGDDTDTTAAIYGQLAGAHYGYKNLPPAWLERVYARSFINCLSEWIVYEGQRWRLEESLYISELINIQQLKFHIPINSTTTSKANSNRNINIFQPSLQQNSKANLKTEQTHQALSSYTSKPGTEPVQRKNSTANTGANPSNNDNHTSAGSMRDFNSGIGNNPKLASNKNASAPQRSSTEGKVYVTESLTPIHAHEALQTCEDVSRWLKSLGREFSVYVDIFMKNNVDGFLLLNKINDNDLKQYGIANKEHRRVIIGWIENIKKCAAIKD